MVSQYEQYFVQECLLFNKIIDEYKNIKLENINGIDKLRKQALDLASNFVTIKSNKNIIADKIGTSKVQFGDWCHDKYRILMEVHTDLSVDLTHARNDMRQYGTV